MGVQQVMLMYLISSSIEFSEDDCGEDMVCRNYYRAVNAAKYPNQAQVYSNLTAITPENPSLIWDSDGRILLSFYASFRGISDSTDSMTLTHDMRFTAAPELQHWCTQYEGDDLSLRLKQLLGMYADRNYDGILEVWAYPTDILRSCPDPEISDKECQLSISYIAREKEASNNSPPWYCPSYNDSAHQVSENYVKIATQHLRKMCEWWKNAYSSSYLYNNYPWTGLGYTYDWGNLTNPVGLSEFMLMEGTEVVVKGKYSLEEYCRQSYLLIISNTT